MARPKTFTRRELAKRLQQHDACFRIDYSRGKGSHAIIFHSNINGEKRLYTLTGHGDGGVIRRGHLAAIVRRFELPKDFFLS